MVLITLPFRSSCSFYISFLVLPLLACSLTLTLLFLGGIWYSICLTIYRQERGVDFLVGLQMHLLDAMYWFLLIEGMKASIRDKEYLAFLGHVLLTAGREGKKGPLLPSFINIHVQRSLFSRCRGWINQSIDGSM